MLECRPLHARHLQSSGVVRPRLTAPAVGFYAGFMRSQSESHLRHGEDRPWETGGILLAESLAQAGRLDLPGLFGNRRPVELEIGTGKGTFLLARAAARPELNFLGIEWARPYCLYAADRFR